jgi:putative chitinase
LKQLKDEVQTKPIRYKERSERVKILQRRLGAIGFDAGIPDGIFGRGTRKAVKHFQRVSQLKADGYVGPATWKALWE